MPSDIVCWKNVQRYYGNNPRLLEENRQIMASGECPFCPDGINRKKFEIVGETDSWALVLSHFPYRGSRVHILVVPKRHVISSSSLSTSEWAQWPDILKIAIDKYPFLGQGFGLAMREKMLGGVTLYHLHFHIIGPISNAEGGAEIPVNFGIG